MAGSTILRFIDELNDMVDSDERVVDVRRKMAAVKRQDSSQKSRRDIKQLYDELEHLNFKPDYMHLIIDKESDYWRAIKGFKINGVEYMRLLGTNGGIKNSTIVFVSKRLYPELKRRIDNGRDMSKELVPAKLEAYQALVCSGSDPVSMPKGIAVVDDCVTTFTSSVIELGDSDTGEPTLRYVNDMEIELDESDGYGLMLPSLAERWSEELNLDYTIGACNTRLSWEKGMVFTFDFLDFADNVAGSRTVTDVWGDTVDLGEVELILTTSMLKLWDSYTSCDDYLTKCKENNYTFAVTKAAPKYLENERALNYQFIQSYKLTDDQIEELIQPTIQEFHDIMRLDWRKMALFLNGTSIKYEDTMNENFGGYREAILVDQRMSKDPFIIKRTKEMLSKKIQDAKIGVIKVHGNYSVICGDPYALCQSMFGLEVTGLLKAGELYNRYWLDAGAKEVACFRAPMSNMNNIKRLTVSQSKDAQYWYRFIPTCTMLNCWDTTTHALNGADKDGDMVMLTDNHILVEGIEGLPTLMCIQRKAPKVVPTEKDIIESNITSFGNSIGKITNRVTAMYEIQSLYPEDSHEYKELEYRIMAGQHFQQAEIDKAKGIISLPMPKYWYDRGAIWKSETLTDDEKEFQSHIVADKKPYFMRYIYPQVSKSWKKFDQTSRAKCMSMFGKNLNDLLSEGGTSEEEKEFITYYYKCVPVGIGNCVMNKICWRFEKEFDNYMKNYNPGGEFDYSIMKSGVHYTPYQRNAVKKLFEKYTQRIKDYMSRIQVERVSYEDKLETRKLLVQDFKKDAYIICSNRYQLCDIILDLTYSKEGSKQFAWDIVPDVIVENLGNNSGGFIYIPERDENGDVCFNGDKFTFVQHKLEERVI